MGYKINKDSKETKDNKNVEIHMIINDNQSELEMNHIFLNILSFDFTCNSSFMSFRVLSERELKTYIKIIARDFPKETKNSLSYKLIESEYFDNPFYLSYDQYILGQGIKWQIRHLV